jgi:hypothetical protein
MHEPDNNRLQPPALRAAAEPAHYAVCDARTKDRR